MSHPFVLAADALDPHPVLLVGALAVAAASLLVLAAVWASTRPPRPEPGPSTMDLGTETPALVDLLTGGFRVEADAVPATAVDLAARRWLDIEEVTGGNVVLRVRREGRGELAPYEDRVRRHVERQAVDGVAPAAALTLGPEGVSRRWWRGFVREVNRHGRQLGLCRRRWRLGHLVAIWLPIAATWALLFTTAGTADRVESPGAWGSAGVVALGIGFVVAVVLAALARRIVRSEAQAETPAGMAAASRWLGVRDQLRETGSFEEAPAASVAIWERYLAYATAMGLAPIVQRQLPFETEHDRHAWSRSTGHWRRVRVRYLVLRPGWGQSPWGAALSGAVQSAVLGALGWFALALAREEYDLTDLPTGAQEWLPVVGLAVAATVSVGLVWTVTRTVLGLADLFRRRSIEGELVRARVRRTGHHLPRPVQWLLWSGRDRHGIDRDRRTVRHHVAIDDGSDDSIVAFQVRPALYQQVRQGARVRARVSPLLGYVAELVEVTPPRRPNLRWPTRRSRRPPGSRERSRPRRSSGSATSMHGSRTGPRRSIDPAPTGEPDARRWRRPRRSSKRSSGRDVSRAACSTSSARRWAAPPASDPDARAPPRPAVVRGTRRSCGRRAGCGLRPTGRPHVTARSARRPGPAGSARSGCGRGSPGSRLVR